MPSANDYITGVLLNPNKKPLQPPSHQLDVGNSNPSSLTTCTYACYHASRSIFHSFVQFVFAAANALHVVCKNLDNVNDKMRNIDYNDKLFLKIFLNNPIIGRLIEVGMTIGDCGHKALILDLILVVVVDQVS
jgi:hypothetical protein